MTDFAQSQQPELNVCVWLTAVIQLVKEALLNHGTVPGYYRAIHALQGQKRPSPVIGAGSHKATDDKRSLSQLKQSYDTLFFNFESTFQNNL